MLEKIYFRYLWIIREYFPSDKYCSYSYLQVLVFTNYSYSYSYRSWLPESIPILIRGKNNYSLITEASLKFTIFNSFTVQFFLITCICILISLKTRRCRPCLYQAIHLVAPTIYLKKIIIMGYVTLYTWHMTHDTLQMTAEMSHVWTFSQNSRSQVLTEWE